MAECVLRWVTPVPVKRLRDVRTTLGEIAADAATNRWIPFSRLRQVHFASITLFDDGPHADDPVLVFEANIDRPRKQFATELVRCGRAGLDALYADCDGYPGAGAGDDAVIEHLCRRRWRPQLYHIGHPDRSVQEIRGDYELRRSISAEFERDPELRQQAPADIIREIRKRTNSPARLNKHLRPWHASWDEAPTADPTPLNEIGWRSDPPSYSWLLRTAELVAIGWLVSFALVLLANAFLFPLRVSIAVLVVVVFVFVRRTAPDGLALRAAIVATGLGAAVVTPFRWVTLLSAPPYWLLVGAALVLLPVAFIVVAYFKVVFALKVTAPFPPFDAPLRGRLRALLELEDQPASSIYNHVAGLSMFKDGHRPVRWLRTWLVLRLLNLFYRTQYVKGKLVNIPSIHFAQWSMIDDRRLLFLTNYEGPADSYLDDFFNSLAGGVAFIWHDTALFPHTTDPRRLKVWVRQGQTPAAVRYRSPVYDGLTVAAINANTHIRRRLLCRDDEASARRWLARFVTTPEEPGPLAQFTAWLREKSGAIGGGA